MTVVPTAGETVVCTFVNTADPGKVTVTKTVAGVADTLAWSFDITLSEAGGSTTKQVTGTGEGTDVVEFGDLKINTTYTLVEQSVAGWTAGDLTCTGVTDLDPNTAGLQFQVEAGQQLTCAITNTATTSEVEVTKTVAGVTADVEWSFDFTLTGPGSETDTKTTWGAGETTQVAAWGNLLPGGTYTLAETSVPGWTDGAMTCTGVTDTDGDATNASVTFVTPLGTSQGVEISCTVTNTAVDGTVTVTKTSVGGDGEFTFQLQPLPGGTPLVATAGTTDGTGTATFTGLTTGMQYELTEINVGPEWIAGAITCTVTHADGSTADLAAVDFTVSAGDVIECEAVNTAKGTIVINKHVEGADGEFDFTGTWLDPEEFSITTEQGSGSQTFSNVDPGTYTVNEVGTPSYDGTDLVCSTGGTVDGLTGTIVLEPGATVSCTYTNTERASIVIIKDARPNDETSFGFTTTGEDMAPTFSLVDNGVAEDATWTSALLRVGGTYTVTEQVASGWTLDTEASSCTNGATVSADGTVTVVPTAGETVVCTFVNTADAGSVTVTKTAADVVEGYGWSFDITLADEGGAETTRQVSGVGNATDTVTFGDLEINTRYTLREAPAVGWTGGDVTCVGLTDLDPETPGLQFEVEAGQVLECTLTNTMGKPGIELVKSAELDDTNGDGVGNVGETITFSFLVSNIGMLPLTGVTVDDPLLATAGVAITCPASDLLVGEEMTCTSSPYTITAADVTAGEVHNVATATGTLPPGDDGTPPPTVTSPPSETHTPTGPLPVLTVVPPPVEPPLVVMPPLAVTGAPAIWQAVAGALLLIMTGAGLLIGRNRRGRS
ncbi:prealbumin-like fold domain-containing protein [Microlunatus sp. Y2014]|uniref:prealbumin-like fold domain-containing protein n=1 Tax=Microlunatus sp. Y2014 TaxID=3418488 RepID=UPI003DA7434D